MQIGAQQFGDEVAAKKAVSLYQRRKTTDLATYISSRGEMKISLREMTFTRQIA